MRNAAIDGVICEVKHDEKTRKEYAEHEECVEWSDKEFHGRIIPRITIFTENKNQLPTGVEVGSKIVSIRVF